MKRKNLVEMQKIAIAYLVQAVGVFTLVSGHPFGALVLAVGAVLTFAPVGEING